MKHASIAGIYKYNIPWLFIIIASLFSIFLNIAYAIMIIECSYEIVGYGIGNIFMPQTPDGNIFARIACVLPIAWAIFARTITKSRVKRALAYCQMKCASLTRWHRLYLRCEFVFLTLYIAIYFSIIYLGINLSNPALVFDRYIEIVLTIVAIEVRVHFLISIMMLIEMFANIRASCISLVLLMIVWIVVDTYIYHIPLLGEFSVSILLTMILTIISVLNCKEEIR